MLSRIFAPLLLKFFVKKAGDRFQQNTSYRKEAARKEGEVVIDKIPQRKSSDKTIGEYVDFEEID